MDRTQKKSIVENLQEEWRDIQSIVLADYRGVDVPSITSVRQEFRKANCHYRVLKNTLVRIAIQGTPMEPMSVLLRGPTAVIWSTESPVDPAKIAANVAKREQNFKIKGGYFEGKMLDTKAVQQLAAMPGKDELRATLLMTFMAAPTDFVRQMAAGPTNFLYLLQARGRALGA